MDLEPLIPLDRARVFYDGTLTDPRLRHPEGVAVDRAGNVWCGGDEGEIYKIAADGSTLEVVASTGGFTLGLAFDALGRLYTCDWKHAAVFRLDPVSGHLDQFAVGPVLPNYPVVDARRGCLYVSDSRPPDGGADIWRFDLATGFGDPWFTGGLAQCNGMALVPRGDALCVVETFGRRVVRVPVLPDGAAGELAPVVEGIERVPDGLAFDLGGNLYVACYEPSRIYRLDQTGRLELFLDDPDAHTLCHPTNVAFRGSQLFIANLGRWHLTVVDVGIGGLLLPVEA